MISIDLDNIKDDELALCADEFVKRAVQHTRDVGIEEQTVTVLIIASQFSKDGTFTVNHRVTVGSYGKEYVSETSNAIKSADNASARFLEDLLQAPKEVTLAIEHQPDEPQVAEDSEDVPF